LLQNLTKMKYFIALLSLVAFLSACEPPQNHTSLENIGQIENVNALEFKRVIEEGEGIILDVRTPEEVAAKGYIQNASLLDFYDPGFYEKVNLISKEKDIYLYCASGGRSVEVVQMLKDSGFGKVYHLEKGLLEWDKQNLKNPTRLFACDNSAVFFFLLYSLLQFV
jgi:rhodanese-related sulfurtransferase